MVELKLTTLMATLVAECVDAVLDGDADSELPFDRSEKRSLRAARARINKATNEALDAIDCDGGL
jgi:hypothetical protein